MADTDTGTDVDTDDDTDTGIDDTGTDTDTGTETGDDTEVGDKGQKAIDAMKEQRRAARTELRTAVDSMAQVYGLPADQIRAAIKNGTLASLKPKASKSATDDADQPDADTIRAEAESTANAKANARIVRAEIKAAAAGKLADPADALAFIDITQFEVDDDGEVDSEELAEAIADLLKRKPHLAAADSKGPKFGKADGGPRGTKPKALDDQIAEATKAGNHRLAIQLKSQKLAAAAQQANK